MNFGGLATGLSAAGGALPAAEAQWQQVQARRDALANAARQQAAQRAFFQSLITPDMAAVPQQGPGGPGAVPQPQPSSPGATVPVDPTYQDPAAAPPAGPGVTPPTPAGPGATSAAAAPPAGAPPGGPASPAPRAPPGGAAAPTGIPTLPDPVARLRTMAQALVRANPQLANTPDGQLTLATALEHQVGIIRGLAPDDRALLQAETQVMRIQAQSDMASMRANNAIEAANIRADAARQIADIRADVARRGQDTRRDIAGENRMAAMERLQYTQAAIDRRAARAAGNKQANAAAAARYKAIMARRAQIKDEIAGAGGIANADQAKRLKAADDEAARFWSSNDWLPRPSELDRMDSGQWAPAGGAEGPAGPAPAPAPAGTPAAGGGPAAAGGAWTAPQGLPAAQGLADGTRAKDGQGNVVAIVKGGQWSQP